MNWWINSNMGVCLFSCEPPDWLLCHSPNLGALSLLPADHFPRYWQYPACLHVVYLLCMIKGLIHTVLIEDENCMDSYCNWLHVPHMPNAFWDWYRIITPGTSMYQYCMYQYWYFAQHQPVQLLLSLDQKHRWGCTNRNTCFIWSSYMICEDEGSVRTAVSQSFQIWKLVATRENIVGINSKKRKKHRLTWNRIKQAEMLAWQNVWSVVSWSWLEGGN